ncbi:MAG: hypothetical protein ACREQJ_08690, partial [Candidatus Binatia bacterium]
MSRSRRAAERAHAESAPGRSISIALAGLSFASGAAALVYEILWMRRFAILFGATTPAMAVTLSTIFLGFALGSAAFGALGGRWPRPLVAYGLLELGVAAAAWFAGIAIDRFDASYPALYAAISNRPTLF